MSELSIHALVELAIDLTNSLSGERRFERLMRTVKETIQCDAVVLLHLQGEKLIPLAQHGLSRDVMGRHFLIRDHPRFDEICKAPGPLRFPADCQYGDPYDGLLLAHDGDFPVHACMGLPLKADDQLIGILTLDSMTPNVFDSIPARTLDIVSAMSAATLRVALLLEQLEALSRHNALVVKELTSEAHLREGGLLVGSSKAMEKLRQEIRLVAPSDFSVLIEGETGVGKELVARTIHAQSARSDRALVYVNCAAIPESLIESELFGHVRGAFTGANKDRPGKFKLADKGTLFLDEIGELPLSAQSKLLRVLQSQEVQTLGQDQIETVDVRILAATNRNLEAEQAQGRFRTDLFHRLRVYPVQVPALRDRKGDISELAGFFCEQLRRKFGLQQLALHATTLSALEDYTWPGNVRELEHVLSRAAVHAGGVTHQGRITITPDDLELTDSKQAHSAQPEQAERQEQDPGQQPGIQGRGLKEKADNFQRHLIEDALRRSHGNWSAAARELEVDRANLNRLARRLGIVVSKQVRRKIEDKTQADN